MERFDYVIVGAGSAGCVLAARLSEDADVSVLLLEAGPPDRHPFVHIPAAFPMLFDSRRDWGYRTTPQAELAGRQVFWPRGRMLGGSSSLNAMLWIPGCPADYDAWGTAAGPGWSFAALRSSFRRVAGAAPDEERGARAGAVPLAPLVEPNPLTARFFAAAAAAGLGRIGPECVAEGVGAPLVTQAAGRRASAADAYLRPARARRNLAVRTGVHVCGIDFAGRRATGVRYRHGRSEHAVAAAAEVIVAAGAIGSPQLLACSGIGPGSTLQRLGIPVVVDHPRVGAGLVDHLVSGIARATRAPLSLLSARSPAALARYVARRRGPLTSTLLEAFGFVRSRSDLALPDLELAFLPVAFLDEGLRPPSVHGVSLGAVLLQPRSRGSVRICSPDAAVAPEVDPAYLSDPDGADRTALAAGIRRCQQILATEPLASALGASLQPAGLEGADAVAAALTGSSQTLYHPAATCALGSAADAVLDPECRVRGTVALRVVDASAMPSLPRGHTHAATLVLAERAAELIRRRR